MDNVILTPHIGGSTREAQDAVGIQIAQQVVEYLTTGVFQNAVNVPSVSYEEYVEMQPYLLLAERLGAVAAQIADGNLFEVVLRYGGRIGNWKTELMRNATLMGILHKAEQANVVNATSIAQARGIQVREAAAHREAGSNPDVLTIKVKTSLQELVVRGTVLHGESPRLLSVDLIDIEARLEPNLIFMRNQDIPGVVAHVGTTLARNGVNIADFSLGRAELGPYPREAAAVVRVDGSVPDKVLVELRSFSAVKQAKAIYLPVGEGRSEEEADFGNGTGSGAGI
jgi:D-3-phosphoglycerate dehydrogenase